MLANVCIKYEDAKYYILIYYILTYISYHHIEAMALCPIILSCLRKCLVIIRLMIS